MTYSIEIRISNPSSVTRSVLLEKQILKDHGDLIVVKILRNDSNFEALLSQVQNMQERGLDKEFVSFVDCRFLWSEDELDSATAFVVNPYRRYYNEVNLERTIFESTAKLDCGFKRIQKSPLVLPRLRKGGSEIKYLSNGSLIVQKRIRKELRQHDLPNLKLIPVEKKLPKNYDELRILDFCIADTLVEKESDADWYQIVSKEPVPVKNRNFDPFGFYSTASDLEPYSHVFRVDDTPLKGSHKFIDGGFTDVGFGGIHKGLWHFYRPLIISRELLPIFQSARQQSIVFDPFLDE